MEAGMNPRSRPTMNFESTPHPIDILLVEDNVATSASPKKCSLTAKFTII